MNVLELAGKYVGLEKVASTKGGEYVGACPGCGGTDRFHVWPEQKNGEGSWWCRGCGKAGDGIQFLIEFDGKTFPEACEVLDKPLPDRDSFNAPGRSWQKHRAPAWQPAKVTPPAGVDAALWREKAGKFVAWAHERLMENGDQLDYLAGRGIKKETVVRFQLGYNPGEGKYHAFFRPRGAWGLPKETRDDGREKRLWIPRGIVIPHIERVQGFEGSRVRGEDQGRHHENTNDRKHEKEKSEVLRIRIRRNTEDLTEKFSARYYVVPGSTMAPMLMGADRPAFVVIETELDGMLVFQEAGDLAGVLAVGSAAAKPDDAAAGALKKSVCILNSLDFDQAGYGAWRWWEKEFPQAERWPVPVGKDPGEAFEQGLDLRAWVLSGLPPAFSIRAGSVSAKASPDRRVGPFSLNGNNKGAGVSADDMTGAGHGGRNKEAATGDPSQNNAPSVPAEAPEGLKELYGLLCRLPVKVIKRDGHLRLAEKMGYEHWEESRRVSHLVFMDPEVFAYIMDHPAGVVMSDNLFDGFKC